MDSRWARFVVATILAVTITAGGAAGLADAAEPIVVGSCATTVQGAPGTPVELSPSAVVAPIVNLIDAIPLLGPPLAQPFATAFTALPPIPLGVLPTGTGTISGAQIASAVVDQLNNLPLLGPILGVLVGGVRSTLTSVCGIAMTGVNAVAAPVQDGTAVVDQGSHQAQQSVGLSPKPAISSPTPGKTGAPGGHSPQQGGAQAPVSSNSPAVGGVPGIGGPGPFGDGSLMDFGLAQSPLSRYSGIPFASAGLFAPSPGVRYGGTVPGYAPGFGVVGQDGLVPPDGVQTAGHAEALGAGGALANGIGLPMLLAVLMLAGVTAALVRTWVLRRTLRGLAS